VISKENLASVGGLKFNICLVWWANPSGPSTRWNRECFESAGHDVTVSSEIPSWADLVFSPIPNLNFDSIGQPVVLQFGGYGRQLCLPGRGFSDTVGRCMEEADLTTVLDPNMTIEMEEWGVDSSKTVTIPNATPPITIPPKNDPKFTVLCPTTDPTDGFKRLDRFVEAARIVGEEEDSIRFVMPVKSRGVYRYPLEWLEVENLKLLPRQPYDRMLEWYGKSDVIAPFSKAEIFPQTALEAFLSGKPAIFDELGKIQSIHREYMEEIEGDFGTNSSEFHEKWKSKYRSGEGDHYLHAGSAEELAEIVLELYTDEKRRLELGSNALDFINSFWKPRDRGRKIISCFKEAQE